MRTHVSGLEASISDYNGVQVEVLRELRDFVEKRSTDPREKEQITTAFVMTLGPLVADLAEKYGIAIEEIERALQKMVPQFAGRLEDAKWITGSRCGADLLPLDSAAQYVRAQVNCVFYNNCGQCVVEIALRLPIVTDDGRCATEETPTCHLQLPQQNTIIVGAGIRMNTDKPTQDNGI